jgi:hypothetical protein
MINREEFSIQIMEPCMEPWDKMIENQRGRHCDKCSKTVVDTSGFSPEEIFKIYMEKKGNVCMRIPTTIIDKQFQIPVEQGSGFHHIWQKALLFACLQVVFFTQVKAQVKRAMGDIIKQAPPEKKYLRSATVKGSVADSSTGEFLYLVEVSAIKDSVVLAKAVTDLHGNFILEFKDSMPSDSKFELVLYRHDYNRKRIEGFSVNKENTVVETIQISKTPILLKEIEIARDRNSIIHWTQGIPIVVRTCVKGYEENRALNPAYLRVIQQAPQPLSTKINYGEGSPEWFGDGE